MMFALLAVVINWYPLPNVDSKAPRLTVKDYVLLSPCRLICFYTLYLKTWWSIPFSKPICWFQFQPWTHVDMSRPLASAKPRIWIIWPWQTCGRAITRRPIHGLEFTKVSFLIISTGIEGPVSGLGSSIKLLGMYKSRYDFFGTLITDLPVEAINDLLMVHDINLLASASSEAYFNWVRTRHVMVVDLQDFLKKTQGEDTSIPIFCHFWCWNRLSLSYLKKFFSRLDRGIGEFSASTSHIFLNQGWQHSDVTWLFWMAVTFGESSPAFQPEVGHHNDEAKEDL